MKVPALTAIALTLGLGGTTAFAADPMQSLSKQPGAVQQEPMKDRTQPGVDQSTRPGRMEPGTAPQVQPVPGTSSPGRIEEGAGSQGSPAQTNESDWEPLPDQAHTQPEAGQPNSDAATQRAYQAAMRGCEQAADPTTCVELVKRRFGQM